MITSNPAAFMSEETDPACRLSPSGNWRATLCTPRSLSFLIRSDVPLNHMHPVGDIDLHERLVRPPDVGIAALDHDADVLNLGAGNLKGRKQRPHRAARAHHVIDDHDPVTFVHA